MFAFQRSVGTAVVGCGLCAAAAVAAAGPAPASARPAPSRAGQAAPAPLSRTAAAATASLTSVPPTTASPTISPQTRTALRGLVRSGALSNATPAEVGHDEADWFVDDPRVGPDSIMVVSPGTDDATLYTRIRGMRGGRHTMIVNYPQSLAPFVSGESGQLPPFAPSYDQSRATAVEHNLAAMRTLNRPGGPFTVYTGFSQGADAVGAAAERAHAEHQLPKDNSRVVLVSDPRSPWSVKSWAAARPGLASGLRTIGIDSDGARAPQDTGDEDVSSVIVVGDPAGDMQWRPDRPVSSALVDVAGFVSIHAGKGSSNYSNLDDMGRPEVMHSRRGNTTYVVYHPKHHPLTMMGEQVANTVGVRPGKRVLDDWDTRADGFYPLQTPSPDTADQRAPVIAGPRPDRDLPVSAQTPRGPNADAAPTDATSTPAPKRRATAPNRRATTTHTHPGRHRQAPGMPSVQQLIAQVVSGGR